MFYPKRWNFRGKAHSTRRHSHNSKAYRWKYGYKGTFPLFLITSLNFLFLLIVSWNFRPVLFLRISLKFSFWHFDFSFVKAPLAFVCYTLWILGLTLHKYSLLKNLMRDLGRSHIFGPCCKTSSTPGSQTWTLNTSLLRESTYCTKALYIF